MITTRKRIVTFFVLERLCKAYQWVSFDPKGSKAPAMSKKKDCNQYFSWVTADHYDMILTAWSTRTIRTLIDLEEFNVIRGKFGSSIAENHKTLSIWTKRETYYIKTWTRFYMRYRMSLPKELRGDENWTGDKELERKLVEWGGANLKLLRGSQGLIAEVNI